MADRTFLTVAGRLMAAWLPAVLWMGLIFSLSAQERPPGSSQPAAINVLGHLAEFAVLTALLAWGQLFSGLWKKQAPLALTLALLGAALYAATDEYHQGFVAGRDASFKDFGVDALGAAAAGLLIWLWARGLLPPRARYRRTIPPVRRQGGAP